MRMFDMGWSEGVDGPGRRWVMYAKGCQFRCRWCASPESISGAPQLLFYPERAEHPEYACPFGAVKQDATSRVWLDQNVCASCARHDCVRVYRHPGFEWRGRDVSTEEIRELAAERRLLFGTDGGVTFGGGEVTLQINDLLAALDILTRDGIDCAVETNAGTDGFRDLIGRNVLILADCKCASRERHREWTGVDNDRVLENLRHAARSHDRLRFRVPLVPGLNTDAEEQARMADTLAGFGRAGLEIEVLRMHHLGEPKYAALGEPYPMRGIEPPSTECAMTFVEKLNQRGLSARYV